MSSFVNKILFYCAIVLVLIFTRECKVKKILITIALFIALLLSIFILQQTLFTYVFNNPEFTDGNKPEVPMQENIHTNSQVDLNATKD